MVPEVDKDWADAREQRQDEALNRLLNRETLQSQMGIVRAMDLEDLNTKGSKTNRIQVTLHTTIGGGAGK